MFLVTPVVFICHVSPNLVVENSWLSLHRDSIPKLGPRRKTSSVAMKGWKIAFTFGYLSFFLWALFLSIRKSSQIRRWYTLPIYASRSTGTFR